MTGNGSGDVVAKDCETRDAVGRWSMANVTEGRSKTTFPAMVRRLRELDRHGRRFTATDAQARHSAPLAMLA